MKKKTSVVVSLILFSLFVILTILLTLVDVRVLGESNKEIGLGFVNKIVENIEYNKSLDKVSDVFLILGIGSVFCWGLIGLIQFIKRRSIFKIDREIIFYGILLVAMVILWISFDKFFVVNYRPILIDGKLEASYPSTHVMVVVFTLLTSMYLLSTKVKNKAIINVGYMFILVCIIFTFVLRILSGMHWISDCAGGLLLGLFLFYCYLSLCKNLPKVDSN